MLKRPIPSRLTYRLQSEHIIARIPQAGPSLTIHLRGDELIFDPPYLVFARSAEASFRITGTSLGFKTVSFSRSGPSALLYSGLPLSSPIVIERSFMRNTFQVAFVNHQSSKRQYMFSVDGPVMRHNWTVSPKRQIDIMSAGQQAQVANTSSFHRAAEQVAFHILQETLVPSPSAESDNPCPVFSSCAQPLTPRCNGRLEASGKGTGMWVVEPDFNADGSPLVSVIHLDCILRAAHLIGVCSSDFLPKELSFHHSLDAFLSFYVNKFIDHHAFEIAF